VFSHPDRQTDTHGEVNMETSAAIRCKRAKKKETRGWGHAYARTLL
jgi:hypothetical protein